MTEKLLDSDADTCDEYEIAKLFRNSDHVVSEKFAKSAYILNIACTKDSSPNICIGLSNHKCEVLNLGNNAIARVCSLSEHNSVIVNCKFSVENNNLIYTGSYEGLIKLWDIRDSKKSILTFRDTTDNNNGKKINCFDISSNGKLLAAGTELYKTDAFILFWDIRNADLLGGYWESHTDDITQVQFHPTDSNSLISGSIDGLINIYDLVESCEDDAFKDSLNTESSIEKLLWYHERGSSAICCTTHTNDLQLWKLDGAQPFKHFYRKDITNEIKRNSEDDTYIAGTHSLNEGLLVLAGANTPNKECFRGLQVIEGNVYPALNVINKQEIRSTWFNENTNILLTGGEKSTLDVWKVTLPDNYYKPITTKKERLR